MEKIGIPTERRWYTLKVHNGKERKVKQYIEKEIVNHNLQENVFQIIIPLEKIYQVKKGKKTMKERNFYPGYLFMESKLTGEIPPIIKSVPGVLGFVGAKGEPHPLRSNEIDRIMARMDEKLLTEEMMKIPFQKGETVKIIDGPFVNFFAEVSEINEEKRSVKLAVKIFGRETPLEMKFEQIEKQY